MHLVIAATQFEMAAFNSVDIADKEHLQRLISGVGPLETGIALTRHLERHHKKIRSVVNFGIGGAYLSGRQEQLGLLGVCLADREVFGDFGVCFDTRIEPFTEDDFPTRSVFQLDEALLRSARSALEENDLTPHIGTFVTVNCASGTRERGERLSASYGALCENMEGAAVARVCEEFGLPLVEVRAISNLVEDRPGSPWKTNQACERAALAAALILKKFQDSR